MCTRTPVLVGGNGCCGWYMKTLRRHWFSESPLRPEALLNVPLFHCFLGLLRGWHDAFVRHCTKKKKERKSLLPLPNTPVSAAKRDIWSPDVDMNAETDIHGDSLLVISFSENVGTIPTQLKLRGCRSRQGLVGKIWKLKKKQSF